MTRHDPLRPLASDIALLIETVQEAGKLAVSYFGRGLVGEKKADNTPVSEADLAVDRLLHERLTGARPTYGWLSEETADAPERLATSHVWIVDPIDGTRAFLGGREDWTISAALVIDGEPAIGAILNPLRSELFLVERSHGATLNGAKIGMSSPNRLEDSRLIAPESLLKKLQPDRQPPREGRIWANSVAYRLALISANRADATVAISGKAEWDLAAATLLVQEAGGKVTDATGAALRFNQPKPRINGLVAAAPALHELLLAHTRPTAAD